MGRTLFAGILGLSILILDVQSCASSLDCSLNGACIDQSCVCLKPWSGPSCETLLFKPITFPQGYGMQPNLTTWGGQALEDDNGQYHLYVAAMTNGCPLTDWGYNSRVEHGVSSSPTGPYVFQDVAINTWSHNPAPLKLLDGTLAIIHIGDGSGPANGGKNCTTILSADRPATFPSLLFEGGSSIHVSDSYDGPWQPLSSNSLPECNNPAPWVHQNGTIFILCPSGLFRADAITGPWVYVTNYPSHDSGPDDLYEDPFLYVDQLGNFHLLFHVYNLHENKYECINSTVSAHLFSPDGYKWYTSKTQPYTTQIAMNSGDIITVSTRERPKILFNKSGQMTHLFNGVCGTSACPPPDPDSYYGCVGCKLNHWDYTLVLPFDI